METLIVTGAAGSIGTRVCRSLAETDGVGAILALDARPEMPNHRRIYHHQIDLRFEDLKPIFEGANTLVHLATSFGPSSDGIDAGGVEIDATRRVLEAATSAGIQRIVILSSAMVYGAWPQNSIPITEETIVDPNPDFSFASVKVEIENLAKEWNLSHPFTEMVILRPTTALAKGQISWVARSLRASAVLDVGNEDPPAQFLHLDDLASAVTLATRGAMSGIYNVAPDGFIEAEVCRELSGRFPRLRVREDVADRLGRFSWRHRIAPTPPGLTPYTIHPWIVSNDRLRNTGWKPEHTNAEAYVDGTPPKPWSNLNAKQRQRAALIGAIITGAILSFLLSRLLRHLSND
jgi:nucleoside-diphosphate-sugar epimerase